MTPKSILGWLAILTVVGGATISIKVPDATQRLTKDDTPLIARGYLEAPTGIVVVANNPNGGYVIKDLRIKVGQKVERGDVIAVMSQDSGVSANVGIAENNLKKHEAFIANTLRGTSLVNLQLQEDELRSSKLNDQLATTLRSRSGRPVEERNLEIQIAEMNLANERMSLEISKRRAAIDLEMVEGIDTLRLQLALEQAKIFHGESIVRAPIRGVVTDILARNAEMVTERGIAKIVDFTQLRVFATVDEVHLSRIKLGASVYVTFRGSSEKYVAKVSAFPLMVKREKRSEADFGVADVRQIEVEIEPDHNVAFPETLGREARIIFK